MQKILTVHFFFFLDEFPLLLILTFKYKLKEKDAKKKDICIFDSECSFSINTWINVFEYLSQKRWFCNMLICYNDFTVLMKMQSIGIYTNKIFANLSNIILQNQFLKKISHIEIDILYMYIRLYKNHLGNYVPKIRIIYRKENCYFDKNILHSCFIWAFAFIIQSNSMINYKKIMNMYLIKIFYTVK